MKAKRLLAASLIATSGLLTACGTTSPIESGSPSSAPVASSYGVVDSIQTVNTSDSRGGIGAGTVVGGVVGGVLGNQVGGGRGNTAATAAGAVGGAVLGHEVENRNRQPNTMYQVGVRLDNGTYQTVVQDSVADLSVGNRVRLENGRAYRY